MNDLNNIFNQLDQNTDKKKQVAAVCKQYVLENTGATTQILAFVQSIFHD